MDFSYEGEKYFADLSNVKEVLDEYGVAIIPSVLDVDECNDILDGMWGFFEHISSEWDTPIDRNDQTTWRGFYDLFPMHSMLIQHWKIGQAQFIWNLRQNPTLVSIFATIWGVEPEDLLVSFDGCSFNMPPETTRRGWFRKTWFHTDQSPTRNDFECIQSWVTALDVNDGDATLAVLEGSHKLHGEFAQSFAVTEKKDWYKLNDTERAYFEGKGCAHKRIKCPKGSLVLWDSRTIHCGTESVKGRSSPNFRSIVYLCYTPRDLATEKVLEKKRKAFNEMRMTSHWPHKPKLFPKKPRTYGNPIPTIKDIDPPTLTPLGRRLAGFE